MKPLSRGEWLVVVGGLVPMLVGFEPLRSRNGEIEQGNALMKSGNAEEALKHYDAAVKALPGDAGAHFDRGAALYALSRFDEAGDEFLHATEAKDGALKASAFYNLGNAFFKKEKFKEAVAAYKRTLALDPRDERAKWNLEIAERKQKDQEDKDKKDQDKNKKDDKKDQDKKDDQKKDDQKKDDKKDQDKKDDQKKDQDKKTDQQQPQPQNDQKKDDAAKQPPPDEQEMGAVLDSLEHSPKDLEKERARLRAVRRRPPARDW
ncbi:MAG TPA: tetratricopeptide repeat protein [Polyangia bacterium]|nr:tetratricopeptide repeat protein [Polyangia bacterium]